MPYIPVHPAEGSGVHRYAFLLLSQPETKPLSSPSSSEIKREGFNVRSYVHKNGLEAQGIHFFRSEWKRDDEKSRGCVSKVWREIRGESLKPDENRERSRADYFTSSLF